MAASECILCLEDRPSTLTISIFSEDGVQQNISGIISKHFWLRPSSVLCPGQQICVPCWTILLDFHQLYLRVAESHNCLESKGPFVVPVGLEDDPLPHEVLLKSEEVSSAGQLVNALGDNFFDSEVKVEVHDLDLLPQIEIIEDATVTSNVSDRATRAKRGRKPKGETGSAKPPPTKRIKREPAYGGNASNDDSEPELPLASFLNASGVKADTVVSGKDPTWTPAPTEAKSSSIDAAETPKKRRGRPKKVKDETATTKTATTKTAATKTAMATTTTKMEEVAATATTTVSSSLNEVSAAAGVSDVVPAVKAENAEEDEDSDMDDRTFLATGLGSGTDDDSSDSSSNSDSDYPDPEPSSERYAKLPPKRPVVKPKKYRKREKPTVPIKHMTREEIDARNAQQAEFERVILQFFEKFQCPVCHLLVQNFNEMRQHFRASHSDEPNAYMACCGRKFTQRKSLAEHVYVHWNPEHFKCSTCGRILTDSRTLEAHELAHTQPPEAPKEKKVFQCDKCPRSFTTKSALEYHIFSKHVPKSEFQFPCPECKKKLPTERKLKNHLKYAHDPNNAVICDKCGKQVKSQSLLKKHHQLEHSDVPRPVPVPMQCEICGTWLRHLSGLKQHMKSIHEEAGGEHRCHICNKTSTNARALKRHIYHNHECERKFKCNMCEKAFKRPQDLREHTSVHTGEVLYTCPNCPMTFFSNANMYKHRQRLHRAEWESDKKKPVPPNIMQQAMGATASMKMGSTSAFFASKQTRRSN